MRGKIDSIKGTTRNLLTQNQDFIDGLRLTWLSNSTLQIEPGQCYDSTNSSFMQVTAAITVNIALAGAGSKPNGLDADPATELANTWYYVFLIKNLTTNTVAGLLSANLANPTMPAGYTVRRLLGAVRNNNSSNFYNFYMDGESRSRQVVYRAGIIDIAASGVAQNNVSGLIMSNADGLCINNATLPASGVWIDTTNSASTLIPTFSRIGLFWIQTQFSAVHYRLYLCEKGLPTMVAMSDIYSKTAWAEYHFEMSVSSGQEIQYYLSSNAGGNNFIFIAVTGYRFTL